MMTSYDPDMTMSYGRRCSRSRSEPSSGGTCTPKISLLGAVTTMVRGPGPPWLPVGPALPAWPGAPSTASGQRRLLASVAPWPPLPPLPPAPPSPPGPPGPPGLRAATLPARHGLSSGTITLIRPPWPPEPPGPPLPPFPPGAPGCAGQPAAPADPSVPFAPATPLPPLPPRDSIASQSAGGTALASCSTYNGGATPTCSPATNSLS